MELRAPGERQLSSGDQRDGDGLAELCLDRLAIELEGDGVAKVRTARHGLLLLRRRSPPPPLTSPVATRDTARPMRLGLLGPAEGNVEGLGRAAELLVNTMRVDRAVYLGNDGALDGAVAAWAHRIVEGEPSDDAAWSRAARVAVKGSPAEIDAFVRQERARQRLRILEALAPGGTRGRSR